MALSMHRAMVSGSLRNEPLLMTVHRHSIAALRCIFPVLYMIPKKYHRYRRVLAYVLVAAFCFEAILLAGQTTFKPGDAVEAYSSATQRWEPATVQSIDGSRYFVHAKDPKIANAYWGVTATQVRAAGAGTVAPAAPVQKTATPGAWKPGDKVEAFSSMTGRWEPATIQSIGGNRYFIHAADPNIANAYWNATATQLRAPNRASVSPPANGAPDPSAPPAPQAPPADTGAAAAAPNVPQRTRRPEAVSEPVLGADGQKHLRAIATPGDVKPLSTWFLKTGGQAVLLDRTKNGDGSVTNRYEWGKQEAAGSLTINANGTFVHVQPGGERETGTWSDFGKDTNTVELKGYEGETWTASVWNGEMEVVHPVGKRDWAYRP